MEDWKRSLIDSKEDLTNQQIRILLNGPMTLSEAWILGALKLKYQILGTKK